MSQIAINVIKTNFDKLEISLGQYYTFVMNTFKIKHILFQIQNSSWFKSTESKDSNIVLLSSTIVYFFLLGKIKAGLLDKLLN